MPDNDNRIPGGDVIIDSSQMLTLADLENMYDVELLKREEQKRAEKMLAAKINAERVKKEVKDIKERADELSEKIDDISEKLGKHFGRLGDDFRKKSGLDRNVLESNAGDAYKRLHYDCENGVDELQQMAANKNSQRNQEHLKDVFAKMVLHDIIKRERSLRPETLDGKQVAGPVEEALNQPGVEKQFLEGIKNSKSFKDFFGSEIGPEEIEKAFKENGPAKIGRNLYAESKVFGIRADEKHRDIGDEAITNYMLDLEEERAKNRSRIEKKAKEPEPPKKEGPEPMVLGSSLLQL